MRLTKSIKTIYSKPPEIPDFQRKEIIYKCISDLTRKNKNTRIGDIAHCLSRKYEGRIEFDPVKTASLMYQLESSEKRIISSTIEIDGNLYFVFAPSSMNPIKNDTKVSSFERERVGQVIYECPFGSCSYFRIKI
jgi:hypothetical protein